MSASPHAVKSVGLDRSDSLHLLLLALCFILSGAAALVYQTAWMRQFALVFGTSELAVATVLAAYMGGLALGAWLIERLLPRVGRPVLAYAMLELGIAAGAMLLVPSLLLGSDALLQTLFGDQPGPPSSEQIGISGFYLASAFVVLAVPTALMGATLPLLARHAVATREQIGRRIGLLYAANTAGAVLGALGTAFLLLPGLGLKRSIWVGAALNVLVFVLAAALVGRGSAAQVPAAARTSVGGAGRVRFRFAAPPDAVWVLPLMALSGAISFTHEVLWTRMLSHIVGSSIFAFGVMVASFLAGIAIGGALGAVLARTRQGAISALAAAQFCAGLAAAGAFLLLEQIVPARAGLTSNVFYGFLLLLPLSLAIGVTYPLAVRILADQPHEAAAASARVYSWNTVGAIIGSLAAGFLVIPALRYEGTVHFAVAGSVILGIACLWMLQRPRLATAIAVSAAALVALALLRAPVPQKLLLSSPLNVPSHGTLLHYSVGRSASVVVLAQDGGLALRTNGLPEALMDTPGMPPRFSGEFWLSPLVPITRPEARSMLIVGFGGGVVVEGVPPSIAEVDVIELEPKVIDAMQATRSLRRFDPLLDARVRIITNDARGALALTDKRYDSIVSQPSHPWTAGASHLYTLEFMRLARSHLKDNGVFVQWMNVAFVDESLLRSLAATLIDVFGQLRVYRPDPNTLVFVASSAPIAVEERLATTGVPLSLAPAHYSRYGINSVEDLVIALAADEEGSRRLASGAPLITDDSNRIATSSVYEWGRGMSADAAGRALAAFDPLQDPQSWIYRDFGGRLNFPYMARRLAYFATLDPSLLDRVGRMAQALDAIPARRPAARFAEYVRRNARGDRDGSLALVREAAKAWPEDSALSFVALQGSMSAIARGEATSEQAQAMNRLPRSAQATFESVRALAGGDFATLSELDSALGEARWTDPWFTDATQLRAEWRSRVANEELRQRYADEALALIDRAALLAPNLALFELRTRAALAADRPAVLLESVALVSVYAPPALRNRPPGERSAGRGSLERLLDYLSDEETVSRFDATRLGEVKAALRKAIDSLAG